MNGTVVQLTWTSVFGRRRALLLIALPAILLLLALVVRLVHGEDAGAAENLLQVFSLGFLTPLICLIAGTGAIGPEIDDGSIVYLLAKPLSRPVIVHSKLVVAVAAAGLFAAFPTVVAGVIVAGGQAHVALAFGLAVLVAGIAYCALFLLLGVVSRNAVVVSLIYALVWESLVGQLVPGAKAVSVQQWALALAERVMGSDATALGVDAAVGFKTGLILLIVLAVGATWYAGQRLRSIRITSEE